MQGTDNEAPAFEMWISGLPVPQGSMRAFMVGGKPRLTPTSNAVGEWKTLVRLAVGEKWKSAPINGPVIVGLDFHMPKPASEPKKKVTWPDRKPDLDKLIRAIGDALTKVVVQDDARIVEIHAKKLWATESPGVRIKIWKVQ